MAKALGIDIGSHAVKAAVVDGGPKGARLLRFAEVPYEPGADGDPAPLVAALRQAVAQARGPRQAASYGYPAEECVLREITVPFESPDQIAKVVKFEFEPHLHHGAIEDVVLDYIRTGPARAGSRVLCIAAQKTDVRRHLDLLGRAGVDPIHLDVDVAALFNVAKQCGALDEHPNCLVIDIGARTTKALAIRDGELRVARSIRLGARGAERKLESQFQGDRDAARRAMETAAGVESLAAPPPDGPTTVEIVNSVRDVEAAVARAVQDDFLSRVLRETQRTLPATGDDRPLTRVYLTGGGSAHPHARQRIASHFGVEVADLPVLAKLEHRLPPGEAERLAVSGAVAVGTALKVIGTDAADIDLRQEEFRFANTFDRVKTALAVASTLLFFVVFLVFLQTILERQSAVRQAAVLKEKMREELEEPVIKAYQASVSEPRKRQGSPSEPEASVYFRETRKYVNDIQYHLKNELGLATEVPPIRSCLESWAVVSKAIGDVRTRDKLEYVLVKDERYFQDHADITVIVGDLPDGDKIKNEIKKYEDLIDSAETGAPKTMKDGKQEITIKLRFKEKPRVPAKSAGLPDAADGRTAGGGR